MSYSEFEVDLQVDARCRQLVLASSWMLAAGGALIIASVTLPIGLRISLLLLWIVESLRETRHYLAGMARVHGIRLSASGCVQVLSATGQAETAELDTGTMVERHFAWIRIRLADGSRHGELLVASRANSGSWHRLQLVWQLCRQAFGQPGGA